jgi:hypothetical protein
MYGQKSPLPTAQGGESFLLQGPSIYRRVQGGPGADHFIAASEESKSGWKCNLENSVAF